MCSSIVKNDLVQFVLALLALVIGGAAEELLPKAAGVGFPVLLAATVYFARRRRTAEAVIFAVAAGALEDALCSLPAVTGPSFFLVVTALARWTAFPAGSWALVYPAYQLWLGLWVAEASVRVFGRLIVSLPVGAAAMAGVWTLLAWAERKAAVDAA